MAAHKTGRNWVQILSRPGVLFALVFGVALAVRAAYLAEASSNPCYELVHMDPEYNLEWARSMATGQWVPPFDRLRETAYFRAPFYSMFLAGLLKISGGSLWTLRWVQALMGSLSCALACLLARRCFGAKEGLLTGLLCAGYWVLAYFDGQFLLPVLLVFLGLAGFNLLAQALDRGRPGVAGLAGLVFGLFAVTRPNILAFFPVLVVWGGWAARSWPRLRRVAFAGLLAVGCLLPPLIATVRNRVVSGDWVVVASQGGVNFYIGNNPQSNGMQAVVPGTRATWWGGYEDTVALAEQAAGRPLKASEISDYWYEQAFEFIRREPIVWLKLTARKAWALVGDVEIPNNAPYEAQRRDTWTLSAIPLGFGLLMALFVVAAPGWLPRGPPPPECSPHRRALLVLMGLFLAVYAATVVAFFVTGRFRIPLIPYVAMGASVALVRWGGFLKARQWKAAVWMALIALGLFGLLRIDGLGTRRGTSDFAQLSAAQDALQLGDAEEAIRGLERLQKEGSLDAPEVAITLARAHLMRGNAEDSAAILAVAEEGLTCHPDTPELLWYAAAGYAKAGNWPRAHDRVEQLLRHDPSDLQAMHLCCKALIEQSRHEDAKAVFLRASRLSPDHPAVCDMQRMLAKVD
jgi:4-amino-4-deoxy-L-arabinose transferase-like glycosyltransferase